MQPPRKATNAKTSQPYLQFWLEHRPANKRKKQIGPRRARSSQRSEAATEFRIISRKDAKAAKRKKYLSELSVLGALARGISESEMFRILESLPKLRNFSSIVVHV